MKAISLVMILAVVGAALAEDMCPTTENPVYDMGHLPYDCYEPFTDCSTTLCACVGMTFDTTDKECKSANARRSEDMCGEVTDCLHNYVLCVNNEFAAAEDSGFAANCTSDAATFSYYHSQALQIVVNPDSYNTSDLFGSCNTFVCGIANATGCELSLPTICVPPAGITEDITPVPGSTPAPTNPDGSYAVATTVIKLVITFHADFDTLVSTSDGKQKIFTIMTDALTKKLHYKTVTKTIKYTSSGGQITTARRKNLALAAGDLQVNADATIPTSDSATLNSVLANVNSLKNDQSTSWYSALATACGCTIPAPTITSTVVQVPAPSPSSPSSSSACSTGCIAGVVIGGTAAVTIGVGAVAYVSMKKSAAVAPDPSK